MAICWELRRKRGGGEAYLTCQGGKKQTEGTQRKTYKLASAEDSDVPYPKMKGHNNYHEPPRPSSAVCQAELELEGERAFAHGVSVLPFLIN